MENPLFYAAVFWIIKNNEWKILFQKRANTWYRDGFYQLPAGHIESYEGMSESLKRELKEEINISVKNMRQVHITHWINPTWREYFNCYFEILEYSDEIKNLEKDKCSELYWATEDEIKTNKLFTKDKEILEFIDNWVCFSETKPGEGEFNS